MINRHIEQRIEPEIFGGHHTSYTLARGIAMDDGREKIITILSQSRLNFPQKKRVTNLICGL
jgi:hypothetical protein